MSILDKFKRKVDGVDVSENFEYAGSNDADSTNDGQKRRNFLNKYKLGSHHKIERFAVMFGSILVLLLMLSSVSLVKHNVNARQSMVLKAIYSKDITYSLSGNKGSVENVFRSDDGKSAYVLLKMDNITNMSLDASTYTIYMSGFNKTLAYKPSGAFFVFGSTGYMGVTIHNEDGIPNQIVNITLRANVDLRSDNTSGATLDKNYDASFEEHDQARFYVNFGADDAKLNKVLNDTKIKPSMLYYELVAKFKDKELRKTVATHDEALAKSETRADEYSKRIEAAGYETPEAPAWMSSKFVVAGGFDLNLKKSLRDGYINQFLSDYSQFSQFMTDKAKQSSVSTATDKVTTVTSLTSTSGGSIELADVSDGVSSTAEVSLKADLATLQSTWSTILGNKRVIQRDDYKSFLLLDSEMLDQDKAFSLGGTKSLILW